MRDLEINIECYRGTVQTRSTNASAYPESAAGNLTTPANPETLKLIRPVVSFDFETVPTDAEVQIVFDNIFIYDIFLVYYPGFLDATELNSENVANSVNCQIVVSTKILIKDLTPTTVYTFCALIRNQIIQSPFQCKSYQTQTPFKRQAWIYQEQKVIVFTSFLMLLLLSLVVGSVMTYLLIRRMPRLMRGSKRVVMVNNRTKDVMILPEGSRNNSWQKEAASSANAEPPTYLTPLPRKSFENK